MNIENKHIELRELIITEILHIPLSKKPSRNALNKMTDKDLVNSLTNVSAILEKDFWMEEIKDAILKINPKAKIPKSQTVGLIDDLIRTVKKEL
ncbi:MAG TPA: hypothetical protein VK718_07830 [Ferruginibacter sp.]|jgi:hypothetical protein|nr:hypothetical protein [Ferruginibacter sp.]